MDYKDTLHLPKTDFEMRGNLTKKQGPILEKWETMNLYQEMLTKHEGEPTFVLHDGPPYANGSIHIGHALNKILKDFVVRSRFKMGYQVPFIPGWDTHGLPIENALTKSGVDRKAMPLSEFRQLCENYARQQVAQQMKEFKSLGTVADYDDPYITYQKEYEAIQTELFGKMCQKGLVYKGLRPVYWSPSSETALAEAEIEYHDRRDPAIYVAFDVMDGQGVLDIDDRLVIWTTTPWTIPGNLAISVHPRLDYSLVQTEKGNLVVSSLLVEDLMKVFEFENYEVLKTFKGEVLEHITCQHPLYDEVVSKVLLGEHVTADSGTGCVHTAPGFGMDDYLIGQKYGIQPFVNVDAQGKMMENAGNWLVGLTTDEANKAVTNRLNESGHLLHLSFITHSYPHDWRTGKPIIFRATSQWFFSVDKIRDEILEQIDQVTWYPSWGKLRMHNMIADRADWTISRQRAWGLPIPIIYTQDQQPIMEEAVFNHIADLFRAHGSNIWFEKEAKDLLPENYTHPNSPDGLFTKETDILDVWFDSGSSHTAALRKHGLSVPHDLYLEGSDQYRGWFNSSLIISTAVYGTSPYKAVVSHGFVMDEKDEKFSKSKGNALAPSAIVDTMGADVLRLWVATVDYQSDINLSQNLLKQVAENYRKIRNTFRFMHGNLAGFTQADELDFKELPAVDRQVLDEINQVVKQAHDAYQNYEFSTVSKLVTQALTNTMSAYYLDFTKDILYILKKNDVRRRQVQTVLSYTLRQLSHLMAPLLPFTMEELGQIAYPAFTSIHLERFAEVTEVVFEPQERQDFQRLMAIREAAYKALEDARAQKVIGNSLKAQLNFHLDEEDQALVDRYFGEQFAQWLIVSKVNFVEQPVTEVLGVQVEVLSAEGEACERCWNVVESLSDAGVCPRCAQVLDHDYLG